MLSRPAGWTVPPVLATLPVSVPEPARAPPVIATAPPAVPFTVNTPPVFVKPAANDRDRSAARVKSPALRTRENQVRAGPLTSTEPLASTSTSESAEVQLNAPAPAPM